MLVRKQIILGGVLLAAMVSGYSIFVALSAEKLSDGFTAIVDSTNHAAGQALLVSSTATESSDALSARVKGFDRIITKADSTLSNITGARDAFASYSEQVDNTIKALRDANVMDEVAAHAQIDLLINELQALNQSKTEEIAGGLKKSASGANYLTKSIAVNSKSLVYIADQISEISDSIGALSTESSEIQASASNFSALISRSNKLLLLGAVPLVVGIIIGATIFARRIASPLT